MMTELDYKPTWKAENEDGQETSYIDGSFLAEAKNACNQILRVLTSTERFEQGVVELMNRSNSGGPEIVDMGVHWNCAGTQSPETARQMGKALAAAAYMAEKFPYNGYEITCTCTKDWTEGDRETASCRLATFRNGVYCAMISKLNAVGLWIN